MQYVQMVCGAELEMISVPLVLCGGPLSNVNMQNW